jgi:polysaccharide biosynthesis transport protein
MDSQLIPEQTLQADLRQYIALLWRWAWLIILAVVLAGAAAYITSSLQDPVYQSTTTMLINEAPNTRTSEYTAILTSERLARTYSQLFEKRPVLDEVYATLGLEDVFVGPEAIAAAVEVQLVRDTQLIELSVENTDPELAATLANTLVDVFQKQNQELQASRYAESKTSLEDQLSRLDGQIHNTVLAINDLGEISEVDQKRKQLEIQLGAYEQVYQSIVENVVSEDVQARSSSQAEIEQQLDALQQQIVDISTILLVTENSVEQNLYEARLGAYQSTYQRLLQDLIILEGTSEDNSTEQLATLDQSISDISNELSGLGGGAQVEIERDRLEANLTQYRASYNNLLQSYEQIRVSEAQAISNVVQVEPAAVPKKPIRPRVMMNTALAAVVGGMLAVGAIFLMEALDDTLKSPDDVNRHLRLPVVGTIMLHETESGAPITAETPRSPTSEAFRSLRTNIRYASVDFPIRTLLVTSPSASEGKSTVIANLATVLAQGGDRTLLIDADMRRPTLHERFNLPNRFGLSSFFVFQSLFENPDQLPDGTIMATGTDDLAVITSGKRPPNPSELLASEKMVMLLNQLNQDYELIVVDSPPVLAVTDATVLAPRLDGVILVIRPGETKVEAARQAVQQLQRVNANILGVVLNGVDPRSSRYGYYYRYDYYYASDDDESSSRTRALPNGLSGKFNWWAVIGAITAVLVVVGSWLGIALSSGTLPVWLGGQGTPTATPTQIVVAVEETREVEPIDVLLASPTPSPTQALAAGPDDVAEIVVETPAPTEPPTITPTPLLPTPGPAFGTPFGPDEEYVLHQVKFGDNLNKLASEYRTDRDVIMAANGLVLNQSLQPDQVIVVIPWLTDSFDIVPFAVLFLGEDTPIAELAPRYGVSEDEIRYFNALGPGDIIPGSRWLIFPERDVTPTPTPTTIPTPDLSLAMTEPFGPNGAYVLHRVVSGQSVPFIANAYLTSQDVIRAANNIAASIRVGDILIIMPERKDATGITSFSLFRITEEIVLEDLATQLGVYPADLIVHNDLASEQIIPVGRYIIYPTP